jgi:hypothetical protein
MVISKVENMVRQMGAHDQPFLRSHSPVSAYARAPGASETHRGQAQHAISATKAVEVRLRNLS